LAVVVVETRAEIVHRINFLKEASMDTATMIRVVAGALFVLSVLVIVARRKRMASKRKRIG